MKLTTKGRYAVTAMLDLALHNDGEPISLSDIARRQSISLAYLEQLFNKLRKRVLVESIRGPSGGYRLAMDADEITIAKIIYCINESVDMTRCGGKQNCQGNVRCLTHDLWMGLNRHVAQYLNNITLGEIIRQNNVKQVAERQEGILQRHLAH